MAQRHRRVTRHKRQAAFLPTTSSVTIDASSLTANPVIALVALGNPLTLAVTKLSAGQSIEIDFGVVGTVKGPFPRDPQDPSNVARGRWQRTRNGGIKTRGSDTVGVFKYSIVVRDSSGDVGAIDPMVVIKK